MRDVRFDENATSSLIHYYQPSIGLPLTVIYNYCSINNKHMLITLLFFLIDRYYRKKCNV
jgi:hypothetical protein